MQILDELEKLADAANEPDQSEAFSWSGYNAPYLAAANPETIKALVKVARAAKECDDLLYQESSTPEWEEAWQHAIDKQARSLKELEQLAEGRKVEN